ncbi:uncharacterized protein [Clytia hemisphaerica]|uniref:Uncharacterized protein n=1 Tax=Clytia hemisphaerica TaxID=252671 RepID=A0A7M5WKR8_9CNID
MYLKGVLCLLVLYQVHCYTKHDEGRGPLYKLNAVADTFLERYGVSYDRISIGQNLIGKHPQYPIKRTLIQFESLPASVCPVGKIEWARVYMYFVRRHRASWHKPSSAPWLDYEIDVHRIKRSWQESYARPRYRCQSCPHRAWYAPYLDLGRDAVNEPECKKTTIYALTPSSWQAFDVTGSMKAWAEGAPNYGVLIKVNDEKTEGVDLRFWNRHNSNANLRPYMVVRCKE